MEIAHTSGNNCTGRAISTMRLALGYEQGLPGDWIPGSKTTPELVNLLGVSFSGREVLVVCPDNHIEGATLNSQVKWLGPQVDFGKLRHQVDPDSYLIAFSYTEPGAVTAHVVVGTPRGSKLLSVPLIIAVSLEPIQGGNMAKNDRKLAWQHVKGAAGDFRNAIQFKNRRWLRTGWAQLKIAAHLLRMSVRKDIAVSLE